MTTYEADPLLASFSSGDITLMQTQPSTVLVLYSATLPNVTTLPTENLGFMLKAAAYGGTPSTVDNDTAATTGVLGFAHITNTPHGTFDRLKVLQSLHPNPGLGLEQGNVGQHVFSQAQMDAFAVKHAAIISAGEYQFAAGDSLRFHLYVHLDADTSVQMRVEYQIFITG